MNDHELIERITLQLDEGVDRLDGAARSRLTQARHRALAARHRRVWIWPAAGGALLATVVGLAIWVGRAPLPPPAPTKALATTDFQLLTDSDNIELYQELDFLEWLEETEGGGVV